MPVPRTCGDSEAVRSFLGERGIKRLYAPTEEGAGLPNAAYVDDGFLRLENERIFRRTWMFAGFLHDIPQPGDAAPVEVAAQPLALVRGTDNAVRAFHNVCSHRGAKLISQARSGLRNIICPNHSWTYELDGKLRTRPHFHGGDKHDINRARCHRANLHEIRCDVWFDWIFVNLDGNAAPLDEHVKPIRERVRSRDLSSLRVGSSLEFELNANWKLPIENFIEPYHVFSCHPWLSSFVTMAERDPPTFDGHVLSCGYRFKKPDPARGEGLPYFPNLCEKDKRRGDWFVLFPNFCFEIFPDQLATFIVTPKGVDKCDERIALYFVGEGATAPEFAEPREHVTQNWHDLNLEDIGIIERMQAGRTSDAFEGGVLSPFWDPVLQHFARLVVESIIAPDRADMSM